MKKEIQISSGTKLKTFIIPHPFGIGHWNFVILLSLVLCHLSFLILAAPAWAARPAFGSADDLAENLQGLRDSVSKLEESNAEFIQANRNLKDKIEQGQLQLQSLSAARPPHPNETKPAPKKTPKQTSEPNAQQARVNDIKARFPKIEEEKYAAQQQLQSRVDRQELVWQQLALAQDPQGIDELKEQNSEAMAAVRQQKTEARSELDEVLRRVKELQKEVSYQSLLSGDPTVSLPKLTQHKEELRQQLSALTLPAVSQTSASAAGDLKKAAFEVNELARRKKELSNLLQILGSQYDKDQKTVKNASQEKKLKDNLTVLQMDNKMYHHQLADLRIEMVNLDKDKARLEKLVPSTK